MNKCFRFLFFLLFLIGTDFSFAQNEIQVKASCFADGDVSTVSDMLQFPTLTLITMGSTKEVQLVSYNCDFSELGKNTTSLNKNFGFNSETVSLIGKFKPGSTFVIKNIVVEVTNKKTKTKETQELEPIKIKIGTVSSHKCGDITTATPQIITVEYNGKLLTGKKNMQPVSDQKVILQDQQETELQSTTTNNYGDFTFKNLNANESYKISVKATNDKKIKDGVLYAAKPDGTIIKTFIKSDKGFTYELLPTELNTLAKENEEDTQLKIKNFGSSKQSELTVIENIYYESNSAEIKAESMDKLNKIIEAMKQNTTLKLLVSSHTDSNGDDAYNMTLSEKRAQKVIEYFIVEGIDKGRLTAKGFGETKIINRCLNGVDCSELEHQLNRRTEFKFTK